MKEINIAKTIVKKRKEIGITQDDLAKFIGVTKASVSKWETGQSYPDIVLLPQLAAYFDISLDELVGYEPQMTNEGIRKLYKELSEEFAAKPFDEVMDRCRDIIKEYYSCFPLLFQMGVLFINYGWTSKDDERRISTITEAKELFIRVKKQSDDIELMQLALHTEATCEMMLGNPQGTIDLLKDGNLTFSNAAMLSPSTDVLLSRAYMMTGKIKEAKTKLQESIYFNIASFFGIIPAYLSICFDDKPRFEEICRRALELINIFNLKELFPTSIMPFYLVAAHGYMTNENSDQALEMLETYTGLVTGDIYPLKLINSDDFFDLIEGLTEKLPFGAADLPRDEKSIKQSMADEVLGNPVFSPLIDEPRFRMIAEKLKNNMKRNGVH